MEVDQNELQGIALYEKHCASCHEVAATNAPTRASLGAMSAAVILQEMTIGKMKLQAQALNKDEKFLLAEFLSANSGQAQIDWITPAMCGADREVEVGEIATSGWGLRGLENHRFVPADVAGISKQNVGGLKLKWAFAYPGQSQARSQPVVAGDTIFTGSKDGSLFALDKKSGCIRWHFKARVSVRTGLVLGQAEPGGEDLLFFGDITGDAYAVRARDGVLVWRKNLALFETSIITGTPTLHDGRLYVPISSYEVLVAGNPQYPCCNAHGAVIAVDASTGEEIWQFHTTKQAVKTYKNKIGVQQWGPSGASVWTSPAIDVQRNVLYVGTAENTSTPATANSDSVIALDLDTGAMRWVFQALANDAWNGSCDVAQAPFNCPRENGQDYDIGASIIIGKLANGRDVLLAGQKSGQVFALDPDKQGKLIWRTRVSAGGRNGGIHHGMALNGNRLFVAVGDQLNSAVNAAPGLFALNVDSGELEWQYLAQRGCEFIMKDPQETWPECSYDYGMSAAPTAIPGLVFAGGLDGKLRAIDADSGQLLWEDSTKRAFKTVNGMDGHGGAIDVDGPVVADGMVFIHSGYGLFNLMPGNVLLAYSIK
jgi:polyvinyl alcohol dehydrogenase (cytochrome)